MGVAFNDFGRSHPQISGDFAFEVLRVFTNEDNAPAETLATINENDTPAEAFATIK